MELVDEVKSLLVWGVQLDSTVHDQHILLGEDYSIETCSILEAFNPNFVVYDRCWGVGWKEPITEISPFCSLHHGLDRIEILPRRTCPSCCRLSPNDSSWVLSGEYRVFTFSASVAFSWGWCTWTIIPGPAGRSWGCTHQRYYPNSIWHFLGRWGVILCSRALLSILRPVWLCRHTPPTIRLPEVWSPWEMADASLP